MILDGFQVRCNVGLLAQRGGDAFFDLCRDPMRFADRCGFVEQQVYVKPLVRKAAGCGIQDANAARSFTQPEVLAMQQVVCGWFIQATHRGPTVVPVPGNQPPVAAWTTR